MNSSALTLGRAKGAVLLGQALSLTVPVQMDAGEGPSALCFDADVFYGDTRQDASRVSVKSEMSAQSSSANVTVVARAPVDEPVVTVYLRAGCESKTTRRYVILAELAATTVQSSNAVNSPTVSSAAQPKFARKLPTTAVESTTDTTRAQKRAKAVVLDESPKRSPNANTVPKPQKAEGRRAHLKLAPLDLSPERDPILRLSDELVLEGAEDLQKRAQAVALWRSLNTTPQDIEGSESRRKAFESDLKGLHDITVKNRQVLEELTRRLGRAESERYSNALVFSLLAVIVFCCLAIAYVWNRAQRGLVGAPWWGGEGVDEGAKTAVPGDDVARASEPGQWADGEKEALSAVKPTQVPFGKSSAGVARMKDVDLDLEIPAGYDQKPAEMQVKKIVQPPAVQRKPVSARSAGHIDFAHSMSTTLRSVNTKEMLDVRQQADFFMTLGQHNEAIALLSESVEGSADANPLVYLELLKILHTLGRKDEYDHYRSGFNAMFSGIVPVYPDFNQSGSGLEVYPQVCQRIVALWALDEVVTYIENCLVRAPKESGGQDFDLEAFRDLLMLHGVASRIATASFDSGFMAFSTAKTIPAPMGSATQADIDLDLSEPHDNLIDFDASSWSPPTPVGHKPKPR